MLKAARNFMLSDCIRSGTQVSSACSYPRVSVRTLQRALALECLGQLRYALVYLFWGVEAVAQAGVVPA